MLLALLFFLTLQVELESPTEKVPLEVEVPETKWEAMVGLSKHKALSKEQGMLFLHSFEDHHPFTMEKTSIPLLFLFFDAQFNLIEVQTAAPFQRELVVPTKPCQYVLEAHPNLLKNRPNLFSSKQLKLKLAE